MPAATHNDIEARSDQGAVLASQEDSFANNGYGEGHAINFVSSTTDGRINTASSKSMQTEYAFPQLHTQPRERTHQGQEYIESQEDA